MSLAKALRLGASGTACSRAWLELYGDHLVAGAVLLTGAVIVWCLPSEPDKGKRQPALLADELPVVNGASPSLPRASSITSAVSRSASSRPRVFTAVFEIIAVVFELLATV
jgi:hypothetical protein